MSDDRPEESEERRERSKRVRDEFRQTIERVEARRLARQARYRVRDRD